MTSYGVLSTNSSPLLTISRACKLPFLNNRCDYMWHLPPLPLALRILPPQVTTGCGGYAIVPVLYCMFLYAQDSNCYCYYVWCKYECVLQPNTVTHRWYLHSFVWDSLFPARLCCEIIECSIASVVSVFFLKRWGRHVLADF